MSKLNRYDKKHLSNLSKQTAKIDSLFQEACKEAAKLGIASGFTGNGVFSFSDHPKLKQRVDRLFEALHEGIVATIQNGNREEWQLSIDKNNSYVDSITSSSRLTKEQISQFKPQNLEALAAFQARKINGMGLSARVWKIIEDGKSDFELALDIALGDGRSAAEVSRDIRMYLNEPKKLFRRVRNKHGNLVLSQRAKSYRPGQGIYRSSYKNALRMTRTEINMAYRTADYENWKNNDLILGFEIVLSNNHPVVDICDELAGKYPADFKFVGWHPQCRCAAVPIMVKYNEFIKYENALLAGEDVTGFKFTGRITDVPDNFKIWAKDNREKIDKMTAKGTLPYFLRDNETFYKAA